MANLYTIGENKFLGPWVPLAIPLISISTPIRRCQLLLPFYHHRSFFSSKITGSRFNLKDLSRTVSSWNNLFSARVAEVGSLSANAKMATNFSLIFLAKSLRKVRKSRQILIPQQNNVCYGEIFVLAKLFGEGHLRLLATSATLFSAHTKKLICFGRHLPMPPNTPRTNAGAFLANTFVKTYDSVNQQYNFQCLNFDALVLFYFVLDEMKETFALSCLTIFSILGSASSQKEIGFQYRSTSGRDYAGKANTTIDGIPCQMWSDTQTYDH